MPQYTFKNVKTGDKFDRTMSIADMEKYLIENPTLQPVLGGFSYQTRLMKGKPSEEFRDILRGIKRENPGSTVNTF